ncbi:MAG: GMC family oxidoreductase N-terminal domain-containing protein [Thermoleophilaceae bacterium]
MLAGFAVMFAGLCVGYLLQGVLGHAEFPFVANSVAKDGLFFALCVAGAADVRRHSWAVFVVVAGHVLLVVSLITMLVLGDVSSVSGSFGAPVGIGVPAAKTLAWIWLGLASSTVLGLGLLYRAANRARYRLRYMSPLQHRVAVALAEVLIPAADAVLSPEEVGRGIDDYLFSFTARDKWKSKLAFTALAFYPLVRLRPPWPIMSPAHRKAFIERCFLRDVTERRLPGFIRRAVQSMLFAAQQLVFIGYWSDPRTAATAGYVPFSERPRFEHDMLRVQHDRPSVAARTPSEVDGDTLNADVAVVGSGAAGAILADRLAAAGREVVILERGRHVDPSQFTEDERRQFSALFADGGLQLSSDARFQVLQGMCVGGTTVVNNAVCFDLPERVLDRWNDEDGLDAGLDPGRLAASFARLRDELRIRRQSENGALNPSGRRFVDGARALGLDRPPGELDVVEANIDGCLGCGYCNIGCAYGKKLSMLDWTLPRAQRAHGEDAVQVLAECRAERIETSNGRATGVRCRLSDGRELRVSANTVVASAGAIGSSLLLGRSGIGGSLVGKGLGFNMGAPLSADFGERLQSYDGLQISHYLLPPGEPGLVLETWFNPVGAQALFMPGWFSDHYRNMLRYDHMASAGSVIGTRRNASVRPGLFGKGMRLDYAPHPDDLRRLVAGLKLAGRIFLAAGAQRVMPTTYRYFEFTQPDQLDELDSAIRDNTDIQLHSSHPQGGNAVSRDPDKGVVDPTMRVHGFDNLFVCDASVFPSAITVNPQLTVMALADYAAPAIA